MRSTAAYGRLYSTNLFAARLQAAGLSNPYGLIPDQYRRSASASSVASKRSQVSQSGTLQVKRRTRESRRAYPSPLTATVLQPVSLDVFEDSGKVVVHVEEDVRVGLEGDVYGAVAKEFLRRTWVISSRKEQCGGGRGSGWGAAQHEAATP
jgi:hypothetical protein